MSPSASARIKWSLCSSQLYLSVFKLKPLSSSTPSTSSSWKNFPCHHNGLALIQKIPTPITPINIDKETRHITLAYFEQKSTVDYIGAVQGIPVCFDAKECNTDTFPLANVHPHQVAFMEQFEKQEGIAFLLISFTHREEFYYLRFSDLEKFWNRALDGGRKSFRYEELNPAYFLPKVSGVLIPYLQVLQKDLEDRD